MSNSEGRDFTDWLTSRFEATGGFTALVVLLQIGGDVVTPITCSYVHVIGADVPWRDMKAMLDASGRAWNGAAIFAESAPGGGPIIDIVAKARLQQRIEEVTMNRMVLNEAGLFDGRGRRIRIDPVTAAG